MNKVLPLNYNLNDRVPHDTVQLTIIISHYENLQFSTKRKQQSSYKQAARAHACVPVLIHQCACVSRQQVVCVRGGLLQRGPGVRCAKAQAEVEVS